MRRAFFAKDPRRIIVRWAARCSETGKVLEKGKEAIYYPLTQECFHPDSRTAREFAEWEYDLEITGRHF